MAYCDCGKKLSREKYKRCSSCYRKTMSGESNPHWKGGEKNNFCPDCGVKIFRTSNKCKSCANKGNTHLDGHRQKGEGHWNWKGGITPYDRLERIRFRKTCHKAVLERDNYTCLECGQINGRLQVAHIMPWSEYPELRFNLDNCRTLCMECHYYETFGKELPEDVTTWGHNLAHKGGY